MFLNYQPIFLPSWYFTLTSLSHPDFIIYPLLGQCSSWTFFIYGCQKHIVEEEWDCFLTFVIWELTSWEAMCNREYREKKKKLESGVRYKAPEMHKGKEWRVGKE